MKIGDYKTKKLKIYLDTTIISFLYAEDAQEKMAITKEFWEMAIAGKFEIVFSQVTMREILRCSEPKRSIMTDFLQKINYRVFEINEEMLVLADKYVEEGFIPQKYKDDAFHLAAATVDNCDIILSWNFTHIVKAKTIFGVNGVNTMLGYRHIEIMSPESLTEVD